MTPFEREYVSHLTTKQKWVFLARELATRGVNGLRYATPFIAAGLVVAVSPVIIGLQIVNYVKSRQSSTP